MFTKHRIHIVKYYPVFWPMQVSSQVNFYTVLVSPTFNSEAIHITFHFMVDPLIEKLMLTSITATTTRYLPFRHGWIHPMISVMKISLTCSSIQRLNQSSYFSIYGRKYSSLLWLFQNKSSPEGATLIPTMGKLKCPEIQWLLEWAKCLMWNITVWTHFWQ